MGGRSLLQKRCVWSFPAVHRYNYDYNCYEIMYIPNFSWTHFPFFLNKPYFLNWKLPEMPKTQPITSIRCISQMVATVPFHQMLPIHITVYLHHPEDATLHTHVRLGTLCMVTGRSLATTGNGATHHCAWEQVHEKNCVFFFIWYLIRWII